MLPSLDPFEIVDPLDEVMSTFETVVTTGVNMENFITPK